MKIDEACIDHRAVLLIEDVLTEYHSHKEKTGKDDKDGLLKMCGLVCGIIAMADAMKEVLKS